jgi:hypothetical protein
MTECPCPQYCIGMCTIHLLIIYKTTFFHKDLFTNNFTCPCNFSLTYTIAAYTVLSSWWWMERPSKTCRAFYKNKWFEIRGASCWLYYRNIIWYTDLWILNLFKTCWSDIKC